LTDRRINEIGTADQRILHSLRETVSTKMRTVWSLVPSQRTPHFGDELIGVVRLAQDRADRVVLDPGDIVGREELPRPRRLVGAFHANS